MQEDDRRPLSCHFIRDSDSGNLDEVGPGVESLLHVLVILYNIAISSGPEGNLARASGLLRSVAHLLPLSRWTTFAPPMRRLTSIAGGSNFITLKTSTLVSKMRMKSFVTRASRMPGVHSSRY